MSAAEGESRPYTRQILILAASQNNISPLSTVAIFITAIMTIHRVFRNRNVDLGNLMDEALNTKKSLCLLDCTYC